MTRIAFIGIGNMGLPMATNLLKAGYAVEAFDLRPEAREAIRERGAGVAASTAEAASRAEVLISMLPDSPDVEEAYLGPGGVLEGARPGLLCVDMSTIDPATTRRVGARLAAVGVGLLDAPVSGAVPRAVDGTLTIMVGGEAALLERARPILAAMGRTIVHVGPLGSGEVAKICNNLVAGVTMIALSEAFAIGLRSGVDPRVLHQVISASSGNCWALEHNCPVPGLAPRAASNRDYEPGFMTDLMAKDMNLARTTARQLGASCFSGSLAHELYTLASRHGLGRKDFSSIIRFLTAGDLAPRPV